MPDEHRKIFGQFLADYSGICNFNYKAFVSLRCCHSHSRRKALHDVTSESWKQVRDTGELSIFELNTRIGRLSLATFLVSNTFR